MKIPLLIKLLLLAALAVNLSGCIIIPDWDEGGHGYHHGGYYKHHEGHHDD